MLLCAASKKIMAIGELKVCWPAAGTPSTQRGGASIWPVFVCTVLINVLEHTNSVCINALVCTNADQILTLFEYRVCCLTSTYHGIASILVCI